MYWLETPMQTQPTHSQHTWVSVHYLETFQIIVKFSSDVRVACISVTCKYMLRLLWKVVSLQQKSVHSLISSLFPYWTIVLQLARMMLVDAKFLV